MIRPTRTTARLALAIVAALAALPAGAAAAPPAGDEYVLEIPGVKPTGGSVVSENEESAGSVGGGIQYGVAGESTTPAGPLAALGDSLRAVPASMAVGLGAVLTLLLIGGIRRHQPRRSD